MEGRKCCLCEEWKPRKEVKVLYPNENIPWRKMYICSDCIEKHSFTDEDQRKQMTNDHYAEIEAVDNIEKMYNL